MNKNIVDFLPIIGIFLILLLTWFLPNYSLYDYIKGIQNPVEEKGALVNCKTCKATGQTEQDVNLLMAQATCAIWLNVHTNKCKVCTKEKFCEMAQQKYNEIMNAYKEAGPKMEMAACPDCLGMGSYTQYKGYRMGREKL